MSTSSRPRDPAAEQTGPGSAREGSESSRVGRSPRREAALAVVTLAVILVAGADFLLAQTLKLSPSALERPRLTDVFSPACRCGSREVARLAFTVRRPLRFDATMIDARGRPVRTLARGLRWEPGRRTLVWNGLTNAGLTAPDGVYRLQLVLLDGEPEEVVVPTPVRIDTVRPLVKLISVAPREVTPAPPGARTADPILVRYRADEVASPTLLVDGRPATRRGPQRAGRGAFDWGGRVDDRPARPGRHRLSVQVRDRAGNLSSPSARAEVRVRPAQDGARG